ncbi:metalloprotease [Cetacean poxvirus 1]|nr:metalloprotease [Cetacean poxvirus 1]
MIVLSNGVRIFINNNSNKDIYLGISNFGFENDLNSILGVAHLLEHILISFDSNKFIANASTSRSYMSFWCKSIGNSTENDAIKKLTSWFFNNKGKLKDTFNINRIRDHIKELENEYYFRNELFNCMDVLTFINGGDLYNGGRLTMLNYIDKIQKILYQRMHSIIGPNVVIFVNKLYNDTVLFFENTFGKLPSCPESFRVISNPSINYNTVMMPTPFYVVMVKIDPTLENVLGILCILEHYHLIDYETINGQLYISLSFIKERDYDNFLEGIDVLKFDVPSIVNMNFDEEFIMNIYLHFSFVSHDILDYLIDINDNCDNILRLLEQQIYKSVYNRDIICIYPNFSKSMFNTNDTQMHKIAIMKTQKNYVPINNCITSNIIKLIKKNNTNNEVFVRYGDSGLLKYVALSMHMHNYFSLHREHNGIIFKHKFLPEDMKVILESDLFLKFAKSKPSVMYQYMFLSFFVSGNSMNDILSCRNSILDFKHHNNIILFKKDTRFNIVTKSNFLCGVLKGKCLSSKSITETMWLLKRKGLIYSLDNTKLKGRGTFYVFMFTLYPEKVFNVLIKHNDVTSYCLIVSTKGEVENFSSLKKDVILKLS